MTDGRGVSKYAGGLMDRRFPAELREETRYSKTFVDTMGVRFTYTAERIKGRGQCRVLMVDGGFEGRTVAQIATRSDPPAYLTKYVHSRFLAEGLALVGRGTAMKLAGGIKAGKIELEQEEEQ